MSLSARKLLVASPRTVFRTQSQRDDLINPAKTRTELIALLSELVRAGHTMVFTAVNSDHHDDSGLGMHTHRNGFCADLWPLNSAQDGDYMDASDPKFATFLDDIATASFLYQIGLAGSADSEANRIAAGETVFNDDGGDHVHCGAG